MIIIGQFTKDNDTFCGHITSLNIDCACTFLPIEKRKSDRAPSHRVVLTNNAEVEIGAVWLHTSKNAGDYLAIHIDSPFLPAPIKAFVFQSKHQKNSWQLQWSRPETTPGKGEEDA